jgi:hypothetical protein
MDASFQLMQDEETGRLFWTSVPPRTEPHETFQFWARNHNGDEVVCEWWHDGDEFRVSSRNFYSSKSVKEFLGHEWRFGPRIPTAAELHQHAEAMTANIVARAEAERRVRELEASLAHERRCHYALLDAAQECGSAIHAALGLPPSDDVFQELGNVTVLVEKLR